MYRNAIRAIVASFLILLCFPAGGLAERSFAPKMLLTVEEQAWLADHPVVTIRISHDYPPFEFNEDGEFRGLAVDYLSLLSDLTGLTFRPAPEMSWMEALESMRDQTGVDMTLLITHTQEREAFYHFTRDYIRFPEVIITRRDSDFVSDLSDLAGHMVATENGFVESDKLRVDIPEVRLLETETTAQALNAVAQGGADAYVGNLAVATYLIDKHGLFNLKIAAPAPYGDDSYAMAARKDWPQLISIMEKGLDFITSQDHHRIRNKWFSVRYEYGLNWGDIAKWVLVAVLISMFFIVQLRRMVKQRTRELQGMHDNLEVLVEERTRELKSAQEELVKSERLALLGQLTSTVSHELRNPLGSINNVLFTLNKALETGDAEKAKWASEIVERNSRRCDRIVTELLDFTRRPMQDLVDVRIDSWLEMVLQEYRWPETVTLQSDLQCPAKVRIDTESMRRALTNVLDNAIQAIETSQKSVGQVAIRCRSYADGVEIEVTDTGAGMSDETLGMVFEPLFSTKPFGVGLGASIVKNIMTDHGGGISYASREGEGTTVTLWLPVSQSAPDS